MAAQHMIIFADGHLHWYPFYRSDAAVECLLRNLDAVGRESRAGDSPSLNLGFLVEGAGYSFFEALKAGNVNFSAPNIAISPGGDGKSLLFMQRGVCRLCLIGGRQIVSGERIEVLGLGLVDPIADGQSARETIRQILDLGGIPVLPWAPGKWLFDRAAAIGEIIKSARPGELTIGDSSLRPRTWPMPRLMKLACAKGLTLIPGSDPLPLSGEEKTMGSYGFIYTGPFDLEQPALSAARMLSGDPACIRPAGARNGLPRVVCRLARLRSAKKKGRV